MKLNIKILIFLVTLLSLPYFASAYSGFHDTIVDFNNNVIDFREEGLLDNVRSGVLVNYSPLDLKVGSIFIDADGVAKKVVRIQEDGDEIFIETVKPLLREVFEFYDIPIQTIDYSQENLLPESLPSGSTVSPADRASLGVEAKFVKEFGPAKDMKVTLTAGATVTAGLKIGARLPYKYVDTKGTWKPWKWKTRHVQGYAKGNFDYSMELDGKVEAKFKKTWESNPIPLLVYGSISPGFNTSAGLYTKSIVTGEVAFIDKLVVGVYGNAGAGCDLDGLLYHCWPVNIRKWSSTDFKVRNEMSLEADVKFKQKLYLGASIELFGFSIFEVETGGGPYLQFNAVLAAWLEYSTKKSPRFSMGGSAEGSGTIGVFIEGEASLFDEAWKAELFSEEFPIYELFKLEASASTAAIDDSYMKYTPNNDYNIQ